MIIQFKDYRPTKCGMCIDYFGASEWFKNWLALRRHVVLVHIFGGFY